MTGEGPVDLAKQSSQEFKNRVQSEPVPVAFLVLGATEAHGPHLPLATDTIIGMHLARVAGERLEQDTGVPGLVAPAFTATAATCASSFPGTISVPRATEAQALATTTKGYLQAGAKQVCLLTLHFDPDHLGAVHDVLESFTPFERKSVAFVDFTRRENAKRIGGEFETGDCHAGAFETSLMLAAEPGLVTSGYQRLTPKRVDLVKGIRAGKRSFLDLGMDEAYCGEPAQATREEGERLYGVLAEIVVETCRDHWGL